jgi:hypothetical protein
VFGATGAGHHLGACGAVRRERGVEREVAFVAWPSDAAVRLPTEYASASRIVNVRPFCSTPVGAPSGMANPAESKLNRREARLGPLGEPEPQRRRRRVEYRVGGRRAPDEAGVREENGGRGQNHDRRRKRGDWMAKQFLELHAQRSNARVSDANGRRAAFEAGFVDVARIP